MPDKLRCRRHDVDTHFFAGSYRSNTRTLDFEWYSTVYTELYCGGNWDSSHDRTTALPLQHKICSFSGITTLSLHYETIKKTLHRAHLLTYSRPHLVL